METRENYLKLAYEHDGDPNDSFGRLSVEVFADGFSGCGGMWVQWQDLVELSERLSAFPLPADNPIDEDWGYGEIENYRPIVRLAFFPVGNTGPVKVLVQLANDDDPDIALKCKFRAGYPSIERFRRELKILAESKSGLALLSDQL